VRPGRTETVLLAYFPPVPDLAEILADRLRSIPSARIESVSVPDVDWVQRFREGFEAFACGSFWVVPSWSESRAAPPGRRLLVVDPGRAFGTGTHETTRLCLRALEEEAPRRGPGDRLLDVGTGSGILAVAATLLGWHHVTGVDLDPEAIESAALHARLNDVAPAFVLGDGGAPFRDGTFALVLANITAPLLLARCSQIGSLVAPNGVIILSGLLDADVESVAAAYAEVGTVETRLDGEWAALRVRVPG
jgi:ribosomal protein L11 methyltransferase